MAGHEDQTEQIVCEVAVDDVVKVEFAVLGQTGGYLVILALLGIASSDAVDGEEPGGGVQPGARIVGNAVAAPFLDGGDEGVLGEFFGGIDVSDESDQPGENTR